MGGGRERQRRRDYRRGFETYIHAYMLPCPRRRGVFPGGFLADAAMQCSVDHCLGARAGAGKNKSFFVSMEQGTDQQGSVGEKEERCPAGSPPCPAFFSLFFLLIMLFSAQVSGGDFCGKLGMNACAGQRRTSKRAVRRRRGAPSVMRPPGVVVFLSRVVLAQQTGNLELHWQRERETREEPGLIVGWRAAGMGAASLGFSWGTVGPSPAARRVNRAGMHMTGQLTALSPADPGLLGAGAGDPEWISRPPSFPSLGWTQTAAMQPCVQTTSLLPHLGPSPPILLLFGDNFPRMGTPTPPSWLFRVAGNPARRARPMVPS